MPNPGSHGEIELRSAAFSDHTLIPSRYSYDGGNVSPPLEWRGIPDSTEELVLLCEDPDRLALELHAILLGADTKFVLHDEPAILDLARQVVRQRLGLDNSRNASES